MHQKDNPIGGVVQVDGRHSSALTWNLKACLSEFLFGPDESP